MQGVVRWFEERGEIPLLPPPRVREYGPVVDDPDRALDQYFSDSIRGVAFVIEYCDSHGWMSMRTIRCLAIDPMHPACISAYCRVRDRVTTFRVDRIISIMDLRSGRVVSSNEHLALLAPHLLDDEMGPQVRALTQFQEMTRDGVFALLQIAMTEGFVGDPAHEVILEYTISEAEAVGCPTPPTELIELWIDNLAPTLDHVLDAVARLLDDRDKVARLLPFLLKAARCEGSSLALEESLRDLIGEVRSHFRESPRDFPIDLRATS